VKSKFFVVDTEFRQKSDSKPILTIG